MSFGNAAAVKPLDDGEAQKPETCAQNVLEELGCDTRFFFTPASGGCNCVILGKRAYIDPNSYWNRYRLRKGI